MTDLTLNEYKYFSEGKIKESLIEERKKIFGAESLRVDIKIKKINSIKKFLLNIGRLRFFNAA